MMRGSMPTEICDNRNNTSPPGFLGTLVADCNPPDNPEVECSCCSSCNVISMQQEFDINGNVSPIQLLRSNDEPVLTTSALDEEVQIEETNTIVSNRYSGSESISSGKSGKASSGKASKASAKAGKARA